MIHAVELDQVVLRNLREITLIADEIHVAQQFDTGSCQGPYPVDLDRQEFIEAAAVNPDLARSDTVVVRDFDHTLKAIPYVEQYKAQFQAIIRCLNEAAGHIDDDAFREYLQATAHCLQTGSPGDYQQMQRKWLDAREYPVQLVFVWDETYSDTLLGIKGSVDAALFIADQELSQVVQEPVETWERFAETIKLPGDSHGTSGTFTRVYQTLSLGGALPGMKLRAWNLPDDLMIRQSMGTHQLILRENTLETLQNDLIPMISRLFTLSFPSEQTEQTYLDGLLWTLTAHELGHNLGCYTEQVNLLELNDTFEELKANIIPLIWVMDQHARCRISNAQAEAAMAVYLALDLMDCVLARSIPGRRAYARAAWIQMNQLEKLGAISLKDGRIRINLGRMEPANRKLLNDVLLILSQGHRPAAATYASVNDTPMNLDL